MPWISSWRPISVLSRRQNPDENYFIVSNDDGFHYIIQFWKQRSVDIQQISNLQFQSIEENQVLDLLPASCKDDADESHGLHQRIQIQTGY